MHEAPDDIAQWPSPKLLHRFMTTEDGPERLLYGAELNRRRLEEKRRQEAAELERKVLRDSGRLGDREEGGSDYTPPYEQRHTVRTAASEIRMRAVRWLWEDKIPLGEITLLAGREGLGKSTIAYTLAAWITQGTMKGWCKGTPRDVIVVATEDSWEHTISPRLVAAGADLGRIHRIEVRTGDVHDEISLPVDIELLRRDVEETDAVLILLDPLLSRLSSNLDTHKDAESRKALEPLKRFADQMQIAAVGIIHVNKSSGADAMNSIMASRAFGAVPRAVLMVVKNPDDDTCLLGLAKSNLGPKNLGCHRYRIVTARISKDDRGDDIVTGRVEWDDHKTDRTIDEVVAEINDAGMRSTSNVAEAMDWLEDYLTLNGGAKESSIVKGAGLKAGHTERTLQRAAAKLKVVSRSEGYPRKTIWCLPEKISGATSGDDS